MLHLLYHSKIRKSHKKAASKKEAALRAENETRTRDPDLGKVVLYQLSYFRDCERKGRLNLQTRKQFID